MPITLNQCVEAFVACTDKATCATYEQYAVEYINRGQTPITKGEWDSLISHVAGRKMIYSDEPHTWRDNMITALADQLPTSGNAVLKNGL